LLGSDLPDRIFGLGGHDAISGLAGNDSLTGDRSKTSYADVFVLGTSSGRDIVAHLNIAKDVLQIFDGLSGGPDEPSDHATR
jgi:Ca2+-binding RTX toxin-like protein